MNQLSARDKLTDEEIVLRRIAVFKAALAEVGIVPLWVHPASRQDAPLAFSFPAVPRGGGESVAYYRAARLASMAVGPQEGVVCYPCWEARAGIEGCDRVSTDEGLRFIPCRTAEARAAASHG